MPTEDRYSPPQWILRSEQFVVIGFWAALMVSIPLARGHIGLSWDALNHHFYLGWTAEHLRFDRDYLAASYQSYQYPYLYWPAYKLAMAGASGVFAGVVLALLNAMAIPPVWSIARSCIAGDEWFHIGMRFIAVGLAFSNGVVLSMFDTTAGDLLAATPMLWAIALALKPLAQERDNRSAASRIGWSGFFAGVSIAFKFSNGPIGIALPVLWVWAGRGLKTRTGLLVRGGVFVLAGFVLAYGFWGWQLWMHYGNPLYPFFDRWFEPLRTLSGWTHDPF